MQFSKTQQEAILSKDKAVLLSASAGSGKTSVLVERLAHQVLQEHIPVSAILAMTFTEDAAREMKTRLKIRLSKEEKTPWVLDQMAMLEDASICTIDSFCYSLVKEFYYRIPLSYTMSRTVENGPRRALAMEKAMDAAMQSMDADSMVRLLQLTGSPDALRESVGRFVEMAGAKADPDGWMASCVSESPLVSDWFLRSFEKRIEGMREITEWMRQEAEGQIFSRQSQQEKLLLELEKKLRWLNDCLVSLKEGYAVFYDTFRSGVGASARMPASFNKHSYKQEQALYKKLETEVAARLYAPAHFDAAAARAKQDAAAYVHLARMVRDNFAKEKLAAQILDFSDMEHFASHLLDDPLVADELKGRFQSVLVDEFQDTNDLQESILAKFSGNARCFRVGDVKQSIYGFRQARPSIMQGHMRTDSVLYLKENYRSTDLIVRFANDFFSRIMDGFSPDDVAAAGTDRQKAGVQKPVRFLYTVYGEDKGKYGSLLEAKKRHNENRYDMIAKDILAQKEKGVDFRSICILTRTHTPQEQIKEALEAWGIPVIAEVDHGFYTNQAVRTVLAFLTCLADAQDDISAVAMLASPLGGVDHEQLGAALKGRPDGVSVLQYLKDSPLLENWNQLKSLGSRPVPDILVALYGWNGFYESATTAQDKTNLDLLLEMAGANRTMPLDEFIEMANAQSDLDKTAEALPYGKEENVVKIKTMHHSKGLQFPVVYLLSRQKISDLDAGLPIRSDPDLGLAVNGTSQDGSLMWPGRASIALREKVWEDLAAEEQRILYVACTRAEQELVIVDTISNVEQFERPAFLADAMSGAGYTQWFWHTYMNAGSDLVVFDEKKELEVRPAKTRQLRKGSAKSLYDLPVTSIRSQTASGTKKKLSWRPVNLHPDKGTARGTLFHEMAARLPYPYRKEDILAYVSRHKADWDSRDTDKLLVLNDIPEYQQWMAADHVFEQSYNTLVDGALTHGFMDLVAYLPDKTVVLDFKSDYVESLEELDDRYRGQLLLYKEAMEQIRPEVPVVTALFSFHFGKLWEIV